MTEDNDSERQPDDEWSAYEPTRFAQAPDLSKGDTPPPLPSTPPPLPESTPYAAPPFQPYPPQPYPPQPYPPQAYPPQAYPGGPYGNPAPPPATGQTSSIIAVCIGAILTLSCYGTLIGIAPLVLGILGLNKSNSVGRLWNSGREVEAVDAASSSKNLAMWAWISLAIGVVLALIVIVIFVVWVLNADPSAPTYSRWDDGYDA